MAHTQPHARALDCTHQSSRGVTTAARDTTRHGHTSVSRRLERRLCRKTPPPLDLISSCGLTVGVVLEVCDGAFCLCLGEALLSLWHRNGHDYGRPVTHSSPALPAPQGSSSTARCFAPLLINSVGLKPIYLSRCSLLGAVLGCQRLKRRVLAQKKCCAVVEGEAWAVAV
jgi:hypothetical protein